ncbi:MAG: hydrogenase iron-sulfur subunit, partial [Promethearchaeota archaeon]
NKHVEFANRILESRGFGNQRINMYWLSGAESEKFVRSVEDALEKVKSIGPNPLNLEEQEAEIETKETKQVISTPAE